MIPAHLTSCVADLIGGQLRPTLAIALENGNGGKVIFPRKSGRA